MLTRYKIRRNFQQQYNIAIFYLRRSKYRAVGLITEIKNEVKQNGIGPTFQNYHSAITKHVKQNPRSSIAAAVVVSLLCVMLFNTGGSDTTSKISESELIESIIAETSNRNTIDEDNISELKYDLQSIAFDIISDDKWSKQQVVDFTYAWSELSESKKSEAKHTVWFQLMENALIRNLEQYQSEKDLDNSRAQLLVALSTILNIQIPDRTNQNTQTAALTDVMEQTFESAVENTVIDSESEVITPTLNSAVIRREDDEDSLVTSNVNENHSDVIATSAPQVSPPPIKTKTNANTIEKSKTNKPKLKPLSETELNRLANQFIQSYETGDIQNFASLFAKNAVSNDETNLKAIKEEYASLFQTTSDRRMIIDNLNWSLNKNRAVGKGELEVAVKPNGENQAQTYLGSIEFVIEKQNEAMQITKMYHKLK